MKRFIGLMLASAGGIAALWGGYHLLTGQSHVDFSLTDEFSISALTAGLAGVVVFTIGLVWMRD